MNGSNVGGTAVGGTDVLEGIVVCDGGMGETVTGSDVNVGVNVYVGGRNGVQLGAGVRLIVGLGAWVGLLSGVTVRKPLVALARTDRVGNPSGVIEACAVRDVGVMVAVGVAVFFPGVSVHASHPTQ